MAEVELTCIDAGVWVEVRDRSIDRTPLVEKLREVPGLGESIPPPQSPQGRVLKIVIES